MVQKWWFLIFLGLLSACASVRQDRETAALHLQIGTSHLEKGRYPAALRSLLTAEKLDPKNPLIQNNLGLAYFVRDKHELAEKHLLQALVLKPDFSEARNNLGRVYIERGQYENAIKEIQLVVEDLTYHSADKAWTNLGMAYFRMGQFQPARDKFAEAIRLNRQNCLAHTLFGRSLLELTDFNGASQALENAVSLCRDSQFDEPHYFSGLAFYKLGRTDQAEARMEEVIRLYPNGKYAQKAKSILKLIR